MLVACHPIRSAAAISLASKLQYRWLSSTARLLTTALLIAMALRSLAYEPFDIPSQSMLPTLLAGDYLFVAKVALWLQPLFVPTRAAVVRGAPR